MDHTLSLSDMIIPLFFRDDSGKLLPLSTPLSTTETMDIFGRIEILPALAVFPYEPSADQPYVLEYEVRGGSEPFYWASSDTAVATLAQSGVAR